MPPKFNLEMFRRRLATVDALPQLAILGVFTGILTAAVILSFRYTIDASVALFVVGGSDAFETLSVGERTLSIMLGAALLAALLQRYRPSARRVGVVHVMERLSLHQGYLPLKNAVIQFFGGAIALISGQSGGREGPVIHLGATAASLLGQKAKLPNNSMRTLVACGTAAAIASSFNTPIAGVIFAMEVVMMEYTIMSFIPIIVAAVTSTFITHYFLGNQPAFIMAPTEMHSFLEIPYLIVGGIIIGAVAALYIHLIQAFARLSEQPFWLRILVAGAITAGFAVFIPGVMGVGYDSVNQIMLAQASLGMMVLLLLGKAVTSAAAVGLGMPVGLIGPSLLLGATLGGVFGSILVDWQGADISLGFYVTLGMCAMMGAVLQAPLAALMAVLEMTANTNIILPAMLIIVVATLTVSQLFRQQSVYIATLNTLGLQYQMDPVALHLQRVGATAIMDRSFERVPQQISRERASDILRDPPNWIVVDDEQGRLRAVLNPADLAAFIDSRDDTEIRMLEFPGQRMDVTQVDSRATAMEVQQAINESRAEACCVTRTTAPMINPVVGVITRAHIDNYRATN